MKFKIIVLFASVFYISLAHAKDEQVVLVPANICYNADIVKNTNGAFLRGLSIQVVCNDKPARILPVVSYRKEGDECVYTVGKALSYSSTTTWNFRSNFELVARCPISKK